MVEFKIKKSGVGHYYFPKELREVVTDKAVVIPDFFATIIYPEGSDLKDVAESVKRLLEELEARVRKEEIVEVKV